MPNALKLISSVTVGAGGAASIDFTSIPSTYTDLCIELSSRASGGTNSVNVLLRFNGDTGSNYSYKRIYGQATSAVSTNATGTSNISSASVGINDTASTFSNNSIYIPNYTGSNKKAYTVNGVAENNSAYSLLTIIAGLWTGTSAITSIKLFNDGFNMEQYSTAYLYGISKS